MGSARFSQVIILCLLTSLFYLWKCHFIQCYRRRIMSSWLTFRHIAAPWEKKKKRGKGINWFNSGLMVDSGALCSVIALQTRCSRNLEIGRYRWSEVVNRFIQIVLWVGQRNDVKWLCSYHIPNYAWPELRDEENLHIIHGDDLMESYKIRKKYEDWPSVLVVLKQHQCFCCVENVYSSLLLCRWDSTMLRYLFTRGWDEHSSLGIIHFIA